MRTFHFHRKVFFCKMATSLVERRLSNTSKQWRCQRVHCRTAALPHCPHCPHCRTSALPHCRTARTARTACTAALPALLSLQSNFAHNCIHEDFTRTNLIGWRVIIWPAGIRTQLFALNEKSTLTARPLGQTATALQELAEVLQLQRHPIDVRARLRNPEADLGPIPNLSGLFSVTLKILCWHKSGISMTVMASCANASVGLTSTLSNCL